MGKLSRRTVLRAGGALLGGAVVAGCLDDSGIDDTVGSGSSLVITNIAFTDSRPSGYRQFEVVNRPAFEQSETVWLYFEPLGFERKSIGDGDVGVDIEMSISITGPDGEELATETDTFVRTAPADENIDAYFTEDFRPPIPAPVGQYTARLTVTDRIADVEIERITTFTIQSGEGPIIANPTFLTGRPRGYRDFDPVPNQTYTMLDSIWIYFEPTGFATEPVEGDRGTVTFDLVTSLVITGPSGEVVYANEDPLGRTVSEDRLDEYFAFWNAGLPPGLDPGEYTAELTIEDRLIDRSTTTTATFTRELASYEQYAQRFRSAIDGTLDVTVTGPISNDPVQLRYRSSYRVQTAGAANQIGYIADTFARLVGNGWDVTGLVATVTDGANDQYQVTITDETAREYINEEISAEVYRLRVRNSLEEL